MININKLNIPLLLIFFLALGIRFCLITIFPHLVMLHEADGIAYFGIARSLIDEGSLRDTSTFFPPFYPFVISAVFAFVGSIEIAGRIASAIMGALLVFPAYFMGKLLYSQRCGYLSAIATSFFGAFVYFSLAPISQTTYLTMLTSGIYLCILLLEKDSNRGHYLTAVITGIVFGAAYLTRPEGFFPFMYSAAIFSFMVIVSREVATRYKFTTILLLIIGFMIMALPYINYLHSQTGQWTISGKSIVSGLTVDATAKLFHDGETLGGKLSGKFGILDILKGEGFFHKYFGNMFKFIVLIPNYINVFFLSLALLGLTVFLLNPVVEERKSRIDRMSVILLIIGFVVAVLPVFAFPLPISVSYILPLFLPLIVFLSVGIIEFERKILKIFNPLKRYLCIVPIIGQSIISIILLVVYCYSSIDPVIKELSSERFKYTASRETFLLKDTGLWLKKNTENTSVIMARWSNIAFYADRKLVGTPDGNIKDVIDYAKKGKVDYIVVDSYSRARRAGLEPLLLYPVHEGLEMVYAKKYLDVFVTIYRVL